MGRVQLGRAAVLARDPYHGTASKLGHVATTAAPADQSCPHDCALWDACFYRKGLHLGRVNRELEGASAGATPLQVAEAEAKAIDTQLSGRYPLRIHVGGDARTASAAAVLGSAAERYHAIAGQPVFTYTHAWRTVPRSAWGSAVSVLASVESPAEAARAMVRGYAAALTVDRHPEDGKAWRAGRLRVIPCPEQTRGVKCEDCRLCFDADGLRRRRAVIAFAMHGPKVSHATGSWRPVTWLGVRYQSLAHAARAAGRPYDLVRARIRVHGWTIERALSTPKGAFRVPPPGRRWRRRVKLRLLKLKPIVVRVPAARIDSFFRRITKARVRG